MGADSSTPPPLQWWQQPWVRRIVASMLGGIILASCPFWPWAPVRAICGVLGQGISSAAQQMSVPRSASTTSVDAGAP